MNEIKKGNLRDLPVNPIVQYEYLTTDCQWLTMNVFKHILCDSFQVVKDSVKYISVDYFLGRCCFVATKGDQQFSKLI